MTGKTKERNALVKRRAQSAFVLQGEQEWLWHKKERAPGKDALR
jgi:hypothetical protein